MSKPVNKFKIIYYIWAILLIGLLVLEMMGTALPVLPILFVLLFGGAALFRSWKKSVVEIIVEDNAVHFHMLDGGKRSVIPEGVVMFREINGGTAILLKDKTEYLAKKGKCVVKKGDEVFTEFRPEEFPYARFVGKNLK